MERPEKRMNRAYQSIEEEVVVYIYYGVALLPILLTLMRRETSHCTFHGISYKLYLLGALLGISLDTCLVLTSGSPLTTGLII